MRRARPQTSGQTAPIQPHSAGGQPKSVTSSTSIGTPDPVVAPSRARVSGHRDALRATIVVCTRNRADRLSECLAHLVDQAPTCEVEVVVVDNGSTDATSDVVRAWRASNPCHRRSVFEPVAGLSLARNRGVTAARGDVVLFIDDDALALHGWVAAHLAAYDRDPEIVAVGGPVSLRWPDGRPSWLGPRLEHWFSALDHGGRAIAFPRPHGPYGTNMSVRRRTLVAVGGFDRRLGRRDRSLVSSEEADLFERLWAAGGHIAYEPDARVLHTVRGRPHPPKMGAPTRLGAGPNERPASNASCPVAE